MRGLASNRTGPFFPSIVMSGRLEKANSLEKLLLPLVCVLISPPSPPPLEPVSFSILTTGYKLTSIDF